MENELSKVYIKMLEWERLVVVRRTLKGVYEMGIRGMSLTSYYSYLGRHAEKKVAMVVGLIMKEDSPLPGTVKHL